MTPTNFGNDTQFGLMFSKPRRQPEKDRTIQLVWQESEGKSIRHIALFFFKEPEGILERYARRCMKTRRCLFLLGFLFDLFLYFLSITVKGAL